MKTLVEHLSQYAEYHRDRRNIATHFVGIPLIVLAVAELLSRPGLEVAGLWLSPAALVAAAAAIFYLRLDLRYGLRFEPSDNSVRITDLRVQAIDLRDPAGRSQPRISQAVSLLGEQLFSDYSVYQLSASDLAKARQLRLKPGKVTVKRNGLEIELLPGN